MHYKPENHFHDVHPVEGEINSIDNQFDSVRLAFVVNKNVDRTQYDDNVIDEKVLFHNAAVFEKILLREIEGLLNFL